MWRSWVDRINTANRHSVGDDPASVSPEQRQQRMHRQTSLRDLWTQTQDLLANENERSDVFLYQFLPALNDFYVTDPGQHVLEGLSDARILAQSLARHLVGGIRSVPEQKSKAESSKALMDTLRSKQHLYHVIKAIQIAIAGPDALVNGLLQQRIPSVIIKLFRSFIDLPPSYYDNGSDIEVESTDQVPMKEVESIVVELLRQCVQNSSILSRLIHEDTFFMVVRLVLAKPAEWTDTVADTVADTQREIPAYMLWKHRALDLLKSTPITADVAQYLSSKRWLDTMLLLWNDTLAKESLTTTDYHEILMGTDLMCHLLEATTRIDFYEVYKDYEQADVYSTLASILISGPVDSHLESKIKICNRLHTLVFLGKLDRVPWSPDGLPYQHADFVFPVYDSLKDPIVLNMPAFQCIVSCFLYPNSLGKNIVTKQHTPPVSNTLQRTLFLEIKGIIQSHPINYFIIERINTLPLFIETLENYPIDIQNGIMELMVYVMWDLNFVPLKELAVLSLHLQTGSSGTVIHLICQHITRLLKISPKFLTVIREAGLINVMSLMLSDVTEKLNSSHQDKEKDQNQPTVIENDLFVQQVIQNFEIITECLVEMTQDTENVSIFRKTYRGNLFDLLKFPETRTCTLHLFECLSSYSNPQTSGSIDIPVSDSSTWERNTSSVEVGYTFSRMMEALQSIPRHDLEFRIEILNTLQRIFSTHPSTRDIFRKVGGYVSLVSMIVSLENAFFDPQSFSNGTSLHITQERIVCILEMIFSVIAESIRDHPVNQAYFVNDVGYKTLENALILTGALDPCGIPQRIFGILLEFATQEKKVSDLFFIPKDSEKDPKAAALKYQQIEMTLSDVSISVVNPHITPSMLNLQKCISYHPVLSDAIHVALLTLAKSSRRNQVKLNSCGLLLSALQRVFPQQHQQEDEKENTAKLSSFEREILIQMIKKLMTMGVSDSELRYLFQRFGTDNQMASLESPMIESLMDMIIQGASGSRWPNFIQFDMNTKGFSCLEIPDLQNFPPTASGYTWMTWLHIERFDALAELVLWSVWDDKKLVFKIYIHPTTHKLCIATANKQDIVLNAFDFQPGYWYHLSLVHSRSRLGSSLSTIAMYINSVLVEQTRCPYLSQPTVGTLLKGIIGTPQILKQVEKNSLVWDLGPCYFIQETLELETLCLYFHLGAHYKSLFQDNLHRFQTYEASTALFLNLRNTNKAQNRGDKTQRALVNVIRGGSSTPLAENKILFALFACNTLAEGTRTGLTLSGLSEMAKKIIASDPSYADTVFNAAVPKLEQAIYGEEKMGRLLGQPVIAYPFGLDESIWKIGGCAVALKLIERSETSSTLQKTTSILFEMIRYSWRNSEDMERSRGYEIFAYLLKQKRELISHELLESLLVFIGKNTAYPEESTINNLFAYRYVILNFEIWKKTHTEVQKSHLSQFILYFYTSRKRQLNLKRLQKVYIVKKMLLSFRMNIYSKELIPHVVEALKAVMISSWSTENIRAVATFLASTISNPGKPKEDTVQTPSLLKGSHSASILSNEIQQDTVDVKTVMNEFKDLTQGNKIVQMRNIVLEMLHYILCEGENNDTVNKFAVTITNRWPLLFFTPNTNPYTIVLAARILTRLLVSQGGLYIAKFRVASEGFLVISKLLPPYWNLAQLQETLVVMMMGADVMEFPINPLFDIKRLREGIQSSRLKVTVPYILPVIISLWNEGSKAVEKVQSHPLKSRSFDTFKYRMRSGSVGVSTAYGQISKDITAAAYVQEQFIRLLNDMYSTHPDFKEAFCKQEVIDNVVEILFNAVCNTESLTPEEELTQRETVSLVTDSDDGVESTFHSASSNRTFIKESMSLEFTEVSSILKRGGTSQLVTKTSPHMNKRSGAMLTRLRSASLSSATSSPGVNPLKNSTLDTLLEFIINMCIDSIIDPLNKNLTGLNFVLTAFPPNTTENQTMFESYLLTHISQSLKSTLQIETQLLEDSRILNNVSKFCQIASDAVLQGQFMNGAEQTYDLLASVLEALHSISFTSRSTPLESSLTSLYRAFNRMILLKISELEQSDSEPEQISAFLSYCIHHQKIILSAKNVDMEFLRCLCYHLYQFLIMNIPSVRVDAMNVWKLLILQKSEMVVSIFKVRIRGLENDELIDGFRQMLEMDAETFFVWIDSRKVELNILFKENVYKTWENVIFQENKYSRETLKNNQIRRINKLKKIQKRQIYEEEVLKEYNAKTVGWSRSIQEVEMSRFTKALQDNDGHESFISSEWIRISSDLMRDRAIWGHEKDSKHAKWRLDYTEGRHRMRKKIQRIETLTTNIYLPKQTAIIPLKINETASDEIENASGLKKLKLDKKLTSVIDQELTASPTSTEQSGKGVLAVDEFNVTNDDTKQIEEEEEDISYEEDKNRKVLRLLDQNDMVINVYNISQISGLDAREGLLLLCKNNIYLIDNFFQRSDGEVVEIWNVPHEERDQYLILVAQAAGMETEPTISQDGDMHSCRKWANTDLKEVYKRRFLFRDVALELFFADGQNALLTVSLQERDELYAKLTSRVTLYEDSTESIIGANEREYLSNTLSSAFKLAGFFGTSILSELTQRWERRDISNFQYLMYLNTIAGRSYNDLTQYPVFPWILADYKSEQLDLSDPATFRDLSKPMGAQTAERRLEFADRYRQWGETNDPAPAFHYGTHYSSAMIVCSFLIRLEPFTQHYLKLQGGTFDHADRLFDSIGKAWESASEKNMGDVRELIPEFFYLPEFLENVNKFNFGVKQGTGEAIDSVVLPPWAHGDPKIFIMRHREALESDYVSLNLHHWIDLIFGFKQQGASAIESLNVFHHVSYEGAVDLDKITDVVEKTATIGIINNFGQTPRQLFKKPHPTRMASSSDPLALGFYPFQNHLNKLIQSIRPVRDIKRQVGDIGLYNDRLGVTANQQLFVPPDGQRYIEWGFMDFSLRLFATESGKLLNVFEKMHTGYISTAYFSSSRTLVTGGTDNLICMWKLKQDKTNNFTLLECLRGHTSVIITLTASRAYSILVSGSEDKTAIIWDLNRMKYVRSLMGHENSVQLVRVNNSTGDIITCSGHILRLWTINGELLLSKSTCPSSESILSCVFYDEQANEWTGRDTIITGHKKGIIKVWAKEIIQDSKTGGYQWGLVLKRQLQQMDTINRVPDVSDIVFLNFMSAKRTLISGNTHGHVYAYVLPDTTDTLHFVKEDRYRECMLCSRAFSVLERKTHCRTCGGIFCSACLSTAPLPTPDRSARFCKPCHKELELVC